MVVLTLRVCEGSADAFVFSLESNVARPETRIPPISPERCGLTLILLPKAKLSPANGAMMGGSFREIRMRRRNLLAALAAAPLAAAGRDREVRLRMVTEQGTIVLALYPDRAPITVTNFLAYADKGLMAGGSFYRTVSPKNDNNPATISVIQGGLGDGGERLSPIPLEPTQRTGIRHTAGVISMARDTPGSATSEFFICLEDSPALDYGGAQRGWRGGCRFRQGGRGDGRCSRYPPSRDASAGRRSLHEGSDDRETREDS